LVPVLQLFSLIRQQGLAPRRAMGSLSLHPVSLHRFN
jgi:hypothetical protein